MDDIDDSKGKNANHSRKRRVKKLKKNKKVKKMKLEPESVDDPRPDVNSSADFEKPKKWKPGSKKVKSSCQIKKQLSDVNKEEDDLDSTNNSPTKGNKASAKIFKEVNKH